MMFYGTIPAIELARPAPYGQRAGAARTPARRAPHRRVATRPEPPSFARQQSEPCQRRHRRPDARSSQIPLHSRPRRPAHARRCRGGALPPQPHMGARRLARRHDLLCAFGLSDHAPAAQRSRQDRTHRPQELLDSPHPPPVPRRSDRRGGDLRAVHDL